MHRCLLISELQSMILKFVSTGDKGISTLNALARTCRAFHEPALDLLWKSQGSLIPLLKCMSFDLLGLTNEGALYFTRPIRASDWIRWNHYAPRIQELSILPGLHQDIFRTLKDAYPTPHLLPNLRELTWNVQNNDLWHFIEYFLTSNIKSIILDYRYENAQPGMLVRFLDKLAISTPSIDCICLYTDIDLLRLDLPCSLATSCFDLQNLTAFVWRAPIKMQDVVFLSELPRLRHLDIDIVVTMLAGPLPNSAFRSLRLLALHAGHLQSCTSFIRSLPSRPLESVELYYNEITRLAAFAEVIRIIYQKSDHRSLTRFIVEDNRRGEFNRYAQTAPVLDTRILVPLFDFRSLREVNLDLECTFTLLDDALLRRMGLAWPSLTTLILDHAHRFFIT